MKRFCFLLPSCIIIAIYLIISSLLNINKVAMYKSLTIEDGRLSIIATNDLKSELSEKINHAYKDADYVQLYFIGMVIKAHRNAGHLTVLECDELTQYFKGLTRGKERVNF